MSPINSRGFPLLPLPLLFFPRLFVSFFLFLFLTISLLPTSICVVLLPITAQNPLRETQADYSSGFKRYRCCPISPSIY